MNLNLKNSLAVLLISTAIVACGGDKGSNTSFDGPALTTQSISDGAIRPEVGAFTKETISKMMSEPDEAKQIELAQKLTDTMEAFLTTSQTQQERDFLQMYIKTFNKTPEIVKTTAKDQRPEAVYRLFLSLKEQQALFARKYIQSPQFRSLILQLQASTLEKTELDRHPEKVEERDANKAKVTDLTRKFLALYDDPNLDERTRKEFAAMDAIGILPKSFIESMRESIMAQTEPLSAETPNLSDDVSLRRARQGGSSADFSQLMLNGVAGGYAPLSLPVYVQLKGTIENSKETKDLTGTVMYKLNNTLVGMIHGHANTSNNTFTSLNHNESSVVISHSFGKAYLEGQAGFIQSTINQQNVSGDRYQLSAGYDFEYFTPFVQASTRNLNAVNEHFVQAGCEVDVANLVTDLYKLSTRMTLKGGYHSFKGTVGSVEGTFEFGLNSGVTIQTGFKLFNNNDSAAKICVSFEQ